MKKLTAMALTLTLTVPLALSGCGTSGPTQELNVYNWGEYISDGSDGSLDTIREFESWYETTYGQAVKVNYSTITSNEDMYNRIANGTASYDVIFPTDYMVARMAEDGMLMPLNYDNIPNAQYIGEDFLGLYFDPESRYSIPYTYGMAGIIYDANVVDETDVGSWDLMWNEKYANSILQYNIPRYALGTAMYKLGLDVNSPNSADWELAAQELLKQRPLVKSYVMDEIYNMMESGEAAIGSYYAGDYFTMQADQAENVDLRFYYPDGTHFFVENMAIPTCTQNQELAEIFINFMLSEEVAIANAEYISYACPNRLVYENEQYLADMGEEAISILYPEMGSFFELYNRYAYRNLTLEQMDMVNSLWEKVKVN